MAHEREPDLDALLEDDDDGDIDFDDPEALDEFDDLVDEEELDLDDEP